MTRPPRIAKLPNEEIAFWRSHFLLDAKHQLKDVISALKAAADFADGEVDRRNITLPIPDMEDTLRWLKSETEEDQHKLPRFNT